ncbi:MAG: hypothetical protein JO076_14490 [Verrucomicrobia bacterium]|nr:hypothetical protein [Verrucomicrobiota bacterium]
MISKELEHLLTQGPIRVGELLVERLSSDRFEIRPRQANDPNPTIFKDAISARQIAKYDRNGKYRPLKGAPNLSQDWVLMLQTIEEVREALDYFYPGAVAGWIAYRRGELVPTHLRQTLNRQTGMYRITRRITPEQADQVVCMTCRSDTGCLRTILWKIDAYRPISCLPPEKFDVSYDQLGREDFTIPFLCAEACNLLVAAARAAVKNSSK